MTTSVPSPQPDALHRVHILVPAFDDAPALRQLAAVLAAMAREGSLSLRLSVVEDGSLRDPVRPADLAALGLSGSVIRLWRNVGHQRAIAVGLAHLVAKSEPAPVVVMDGDGEDRAEDVAILLARLARGSADVVVAERGHRRDSLSFRIGYWGYRLLFRGLTGQRIRFGNFSALAPLAVHRLGHMEETWLHLPAALLCSGLVIESVPLDRGQRYQGRSKMDFVALTMHALSALAVFSERVLTRVILLCLAVTGFAVLATVIAAGLKLAGLASPGWLTIVAGIFMIVFVQFVGLGLVCLLLLLNGRRSPVAPPSRAATDLVAAIDHFGTSP